MVLKACLAGGLKVSHLGRMGLEGSMKVAEGWQKPSVLYGQALSPSVRHPTEGSGLISHLGSREEGENSNGMGR
jgi:hypothetical protein